MLPIAVSLFSLVLSLASIAQAQAQSSDDLPYWTCTCAPLARCAPYDDQRRPSGPSTPLHSSCHRLIGRGEFLTSVSFFSARIMNTADLVSSWPARNRSRPSSIMICKIDTISLRKGCLYRETAKQKAYQTPSNIPLALPLAVWPRLSLKGFRLQRSRPA